MALNVRVPARLMRLDGAQLTTMVTGLTLAEPLDAHEDFHRLGVGVQLTLFLLPLATSDIEAAPVSGAS